MSFLRRLKSNHTIEISVPECSFLRSLRRLKSDHTMEISVPEFISRALRRVISDHIPVCPTLAITTRKEPRFDTRRFLVDYVVAIEALLGYHVSRKRSP